MKSNCLKYAASLVFIILCGCNSGHQNSVAANEQDSIFSGSIIPDIIKADSDESIKPGLKSDLNIVPNNIPDWKQYWSNFREAVKNKDTSAILALVNFPFMWNGGETSMDEFARLWISHLYGLENSGEHTNANATYADGFGPDDPRIDSVHYCNWNHIDFYFAKFNGYYKLVSINTPG
jgi:hypothetical protein